MNKLHWTITTVLWICLGTAITGARPEILAQSSSGMRHEEIIVKAPFPNADDQGAGFCRKRFLITAFGAIPRQDIDSTESIRKGIAACHEAGGGRVVIHEGEWLTGAIPLKSNVNLHLATEVRERGKGL